MDIYSFLYKRLNNKDSSEEPSGWLRAWKLLKETIVAVKFYPPNMTVKYDRLQKTDIDIKL